MLMFLLSGNKAGFIFAVGFLIAIFLYIRICSEILGDKEITLGRQLLYMHTILFGFTLVFEFIIFSSRKFGYYDSDGYRVLLVAFLALLVCLAGATLALKWKVRMH